MTKNSTEAHVVSLYQAGKLFHHDRSLWPDDTCVRRLWLYPSVHKWSQSVGETAQDRKYFAQVRAFFTSFVAGEDFDDDVLFKALSSGRDGVWEFRITFLPQARVLGSFLRTGEFIGLAYADRSDLGAAGFGPLIKVVKNRWSSLFPGFTPLKNLSRESVLQEFDHDF